MYPPYRQPPSGPPSPASPTPREIKVISQRQYRANEGGYFNTLREVIHELTGEKLQTRQELLRKAIDLLLTASEIKKSREGQVACPTSYEMQSSVTSIYGCPTELSSWAPYSCPPVQADAQSLYHIPHPPHDQQVHLMFHMDTTFQPYL